MNERPKRLAVRQTILIERLQIVCLQETKIQSMIDTQIKQTVNRTLDGYVQLQALGTRGGILLAWATNRFTLMQSQQTNHTITVLVKNNLDNSEFYFTGVYGPATREGREEFYDELRQVKPTNGTPWITCGDFNVTIQPEDRTSNRNNWRETLSFAGLVSELGLLNMTMHGGRFTWSNERDRPHMARLDRFLISTEWNQSIPNSTQKRLPNTSLDHCPIQYEVKTHYRQSRFFRFENFWLRSQEFIIMTEEKWSSMEPTQTPKQLHDKITRLQKEIKEWAANRVGHQSR